MILEEKANLENFLKIKQDAIDKNNSHFSKKILNFRELFEVCLEYSVPFFNHDNLLYNKDKELKIASIIFENNNSLITLFDGVLSLNENANYLSVNILQRSLFEFLIINNHLLLTNDGIYLEKWIQEKDVKIVKNILKRTNNPEAKELIEFWVRLSKINHASSKNMLLEFEWTENYGNYIDSMFFTYILLYMYNYQLRELYFPLMKSVYENNGTKIKEPYKLDWFSKKDKIQEIKKNKNKKLHDLIAAFQFKWSIKN